MEEMGTISVVIPCYNSQATIGRTLESVLAQTLPPAEILVIDDGSTDDSPAIVESFAQRDSRVQLHRNSRNLGVALSRTRGVTLASGAWIAFLDSDDQWTADKLERQMALLRKTGGDFSFTGSSYVDENGVAYSGIFQVPATVDRKTLLRQNVISCSSVVIRRELMARCPMRPGDIHEDFDAWLRVLEQTPVAYGLNAPLLIYQISRGSRSGNKLESFRRNFKTYRAAGLNPASAAVQMGWYTVNGLKKYKNIKQ